MQGANISGGGQGNSIWAFVVVSRVARTRNKMFRFIMEKRSVRRENDYSEAEDGMKENVILFLGKVQRHLSFIWAYH